MLGAKCTVSKPAILPGMSSCPSSTVEHLVLDLLLEMGYGGPMNTPGEVLGKSHDGGVDGVIKQDKLGFDQIYVQAKRWENSVGRPVIQKFAGSLDQFKARKGVIITTSSFTREALEYASAIEKKIVLIDGSRLTRLMIEHDVGVQPVKNYWIKKLDSDYFDPG